MQKDRKAPSFSFVWHKIVRFFRVPIVGKTAAVLLALLVWQGVAMWLADELILVSPIKVFLRLGWRRISLYGSPLALGASRVDSSLRFWQVRFWR